MFEPSQFSDVTVEVFSAPFVSMRQCYGEFWGRAVTGPERSECLSKRVVAMLVARLVRENNVVFGCSSSMQPTAYRAARGFFFRDYR